MITKDFDFEALVRDALREALGERGHVNILIAGATGVGKSTLINAIFQGNLAATGQGRPVTPNTREIKKDDIPLSIFDSRGLEMADFPAIRDELRSFVSERARETDSKKHIHVAWVCILEDSRRVQQAEEDLVKMLAEYMPVIAVITKARQDKSPGLDGKPQSFCSTVQQMLPLVQNVIRVRAIPEEDDDGVIKPAIGLRELVDLTMQLVPEEHKRAFAAAQKVDIELKKSQARAIVTAAATSAAAVAITPIPFADAIAIVPIQIGMISGITTVFGLPFNASLLSSTIGSLVTGAGGTLTGRAIVSNLLKLIPGFGSALGGGIAAVTAATLTKAFGEAYIKALEILFIRNNGEPPIPDDVVEAFRQEYERAIRK